MAQKRNIERTCLKCNCVFLARKDDIKNGRSKFCSNKCSAVYLRGNSKLISCAKCGKNVSRSPGTIKKGGVFCSKECWYKSIRGGPTVRWIGEKRISYGYYTVMKNGRYVFEHRLIIEKHIGRKLRKNEVIHHINENKLDNRIKNLKIMSPSDHSRLHRSKT